MNDLTYSTAPIQNLPQQPTPFIGRELEIKQMVALLEDPECRLLSLVGPGGIGKTRLAIEVVKHLSRDLFPHGIFYIPLAPLISPNEVVSAIINGLGIYIQNEQSPRKELVRFLSQRRLLLLIDNFEHLLDAVDLLSDILYDTIDVKMLVTSRTVLNLRHEHIWRLKGMSYPVDDCTASLDAYSATQLFVERARWIRHDFSPAEKAQSVIHICQLVEGMPLAIELASSWLKSLSCEAIVRQLQQGMAFLTTHTHDVPERHRNMNAVFEHSWNLLTEPEKAVLPCLSVFRGGFTLDAAQAVAKADLLTISGLVEKSMIQRDKTGRYQIHELLRQYAEERLRNRDELDTIQVFHKAYYAGFLEQREPDIKGRRQLACLDEVEADLDNIRVAWVQAIADRDYDVLDRMMETLILFCDIRAKDQLGYEYFIYALRRVEAHNLSAGHPFLYRLQIYFLQAWGRYESDSCELEEQIKIHLELARKQNEDEWIARCAWLLGNYNNSIGNYGKSIPYHTEALDLYRKLDQPFYASRALWGLAIATDFSGNFDREVVETYRHKCFNLTKEIGDLQGYADALHL